MSHSVLALLLLGLACSPLASLGSPLPTSELPAEQPTTLRALLEGNDFTGAQVLKVHGSKSKVVEQLVEEENVDVWSGNSTHLDILVPQQKVESIKKLLSDNNINYNVIIENLQSAIDDQNPQTSEAEEEYEELDGRKGHRMNWQKYQRLETIYGYLDYLAQTYPGLVSVGVMGQSNEGRPIKYIKISSGKPNANSFLIDGGMHAREWISPATATYIARELVEKRDSLPTELRDLDYYVVPVVNPDGYEYSHTSARMWRKNRSRGIGCSGTDLNRNFNHHWGGKGTSGNLCSEIYRGVSPASEPETRALMSLASSLAPNLKAYVTFHSYGQYILIPYGYDYNSLPENFADMKAVGDQAALAMRQSGGQFYRVGNTAHTLYPASGGSDDWVKANTGAKYAYTIELRDTGGYGFTLPAREIIPTSNEAFEAIKVISAAASKS